MAETAASGHTKDSELCRVKRDKKDRIHILLKVRETSKNGMRK
jgi:hypothetical protein